MNNLTIKTWKNILKLNKKSGRANKIYETPAPKDKLYIGHPAHKKSFVLAMALTLLLMIICQEIKLNLNYFSILLFCLIPATYLRYILRVTLMLFLQIYPTLLAELRIYWLYLWQTDKSLQKWWWGTSCGDLRSIKSLLH